VQFPAADVVGWVLPGCFSRTQRPTVARDPRLAALDPARSRRTRASGSVGVSYTVGDRSSRVRSARVSDDVVDVPDGPDDDGGGGGDADGDNTSDPADDESFWDEDDPGPDPDPPPAGDPSHDPRPRASPQGPRASYEQFPVYDVDGTLLGHIRKYAGRCSLDAHCALHPHRLKCTVGRTYVGDDPRRPARGRPLGFLIAWLFQGRRIQQGPEDPTLRDAHCRAAKAQDEFEFLADGTTFLRQRGRAYADARLPHLPERRRRLGEPAEPPGLP
jgi:hypothetical protein